MKRYYLVCFDDPVTFWTGNGWTTDRRMALRLPTVESEAIAAWRARLASEPARDLWLVRDWGLDSERTIATRDEGVFGGVGS